MDNSADAPVSITSARTSRSADIRRREVRYLMSMGIRTLCFVGAFFTAGVLRWVLVAGAVFLPYVAVVIANATDRRYSAGPGSFLQEERPMLEAGTEDASTSGGRREGGRREGGRREGGRREGGRTTGDRTKGSDGRPDGAAR